MTERSYYWGGTVTGDASLAPYTDDEFSDLWRLLFTSDPATQGVISGYLNALAASGAVSPVAINTGAALVDGKAYINDASLNVTIPTPSGATRIDRIVLRKDFLNQTVRITRIAGAEGGGAPAITQTDNVTWDIKLCQVSITTLGAITLTDERTYAVTPLVPAASDTAQGKVELATGAETSTGTDATRAITPDGLAESLFGIKSFAIEVFSATTALATGDGKKYIPIPAALAGFNILRVHATLFAKSTSGTPTVQIARGRKASATSAHSFVDVFSTLITVDANEFDSRDAATQPVVNASNDDLAAGDLLRVDVDVAGTAATGLWLTFECQLP